jgi:hypothetical protein
LKKKTKAIEIVKAFVRIGIGKWKIELGSEKKEDK